MQTSLMQSPLWASFKARYGWRAHHVLGFSILERPGPLGRTFLYCPEVGAEKDVGFATLVAKVQSALAHLQNPTTLFGRAEFLIPYDEASHQILLSAGFVKSAEEVQPAWRQEVDLTLTREQLLAQMKPKGRYNVKVAERHGVSVRSSADGKAIAVFLQQSKETAKRHGLKTRSSSYLADLIQVLEENGYGGLRVAVYQDRILGGAVVSFYGERASYLYGASTDAHRQVMGPYLLHFSIIEEARRRGCCIYDLIGVAPPDSPSDHPWASLSRFKREFGGQTVRYLGSYDRVYHPFWYFVNNQVRKIK